jgi:DNA gyrase/topoisomerase IV subunit A
MAFQMKMSPTVKYLLTSSRDYSLYVNDQRAIPYVGDGLKHVQRVALWAMRNEADKVKVVGLVGKLAHEGLYVHGDVACGDAISLLAAPYRNNVMLLHGDGQFGSRVAPVDGIGASRYVSVKRSKAAQAFVYTDIDNVPLEDNYDGSNKQPVHFLPLIPTVLLNGISGIGVGYSTDILPRKFSDLLTATIDALKGKKPKKLVPHYERYDVTVAPGVNTNQWEITGKVKVDNTSTVIITELPPGMSLEKFRARLIDMEENGQITRFVDSSSDGINIEVTFKRGSVAAWKEKDAIAFFKLVEKTTERIVVREWTGDRIVEYPDAETLVRDFVAWRLEWYVARFEKLLADTSYELNYWRVLKALFEGGFTKKLGTFADRAAMEVEVEKIIKKAKLTLDKPQMDRVLGLATYRWTKDFEGEVARRIAEMEASIADYNETLAKPEKRKAIYLEELEALKKF